MVANRTGNRMQMNEGKRNAEFFIFARFHAREGNDDEVAVVINDVIEPTRAELGCVEHDAYRSIRDPRLFFIHSRWVDEAAFDSYAKLPHTVRFIEGIEPLIDHELEVNRTRRLSGIRNGNIS
jgi:quinol monooxygenase YgiN